MVPDTVHTVQVVILVVSRGWWWVRCEKSLNTRTCVGPDCCAELVGLLLGAPPFRFGETEMPGRNETSAGETFHRGAQQGPAPPVG